METVTERIKTLEDKVQKLEGNNLLKEGSGNPYKALEVSEEPMGKEQKVYRPLRRD